MDDMSIEKPDGTALVAGDHLIPATGSLRSGEAISVSGAKPSGGGGQLSPRRYQAGGRKKGASPERRAAQKAARQMLRTRAPVKGGKKVTFGTRKKAAAKKAPAKKAAAKKAPAKKKRPAKRKGGGRA